MPDLPWIVYLWPLVMVGVVVVAAVYKYMQVTQAARWPETTGKVVVSTSEQRKVGTFDDTREGGKGEEVRNFAKIVYEYEVSGQKLRASRVSIGEDMGNFMVEETIARYPVGAVVTVYYNPRRPKEAVLERELPKGVFGCVIWGVVISLAVVYGAFFGFNQVSIFLEHRINNAPFVIALTTMGLVTLLFAFVQRKRGADAQGWPVVQGRIDSSRVDEFRGRIGNSSDSGMTTLYRPEISYSYEYKGVKYRGTQTSLGAQVTSNTEGFASSAVKKYPPGKLVSVSVNPSNASESVLQTAGTGAWFIFVIAAILLGVAYYASQH